MKIDLYDLRILKQLEMNSEMTLSEIGRNVGIFSPSAVSRRINNLKEEGVISKYKVAIEPNKLDLNFVTLTFVKAKYFHNYMQIVSEKITKIRGVVAVYFLLGDIDFVLITLSKSKDEYEEILMQLTEIIDIERTDSRTVLKVYKENDYSSVIDRLIRNKIAERT